MFPSPSAKLLRFLEKKIGEKLSYKEIKHKFVRPNRPTVKNSLLRKSAPSFSRKNYAKRKRSLSSSTLSEEELESILDDLRELNLIKKGGNSIQSLRSFYVSGKLSLGPHKTSYLSIDRSGSENSKNAMKVIIPQRERKSAFSQDRVLAKLTDHYQGRFGGRIVRVLERARRLYRMRLLPFSPGHDRKKNKLLLGQLLDMSPAKLYACLPLSSIPPETARELKTDHIIIVSMDGEELRYGRSFYDKAHFIRKEKDTELDLDFSRILMKHDLSSSYPDFSRELPAYEEVQEESGSDWKERKDLRALYTITIDGKNSKDFDDALSLTMLSQDKALLYVHIADVSYYIHPKSSLDLEAQKRGSSYYLADYVLPMLPHQLSENLCSLVARQNRLSVTVEMKIDLESGKIQKSDFYRSIIRVDRRFNYQEAEEKIDQSASASSYERLKKMQERQERDPLFEPAFLGALWSLSKRKRKQRMEQGRIDLNFPEPAFHYTSSGKIKSLTYKERLKSSILIEECMLSANISVAAFLQKKKIPALYRCHSPMELEKIEQINDFCAASHIPVELKDNSYSSIKKALESVEKHLSNTNASKKNLLHLFQIMLLRSFPQAYYTPQNIGHWGLGFANYCHFTSPIRRYPDLVVHRALLCLLEKKKPLYGVRDLEELGKKNSEAERKAIEAERDMSKLKIMRYLLDSQIKYVSGFLSAMRPERVYIELSKIPVEAIVEAHHLTSETNLQIKNFSVYVKKLGRFAALGEEWELKLERIDLEAMQIFCSPVFLSSASMGSARSRS